MLTAALLGSCSPTTRAMWGFGYAHFSLVRWLVPIRRLLIIYEAVGWFATGFAVTALVSAALLSPKVGEAGGSVCEMAVANGVDGATPCLATLLKFKWGVLRLFCAEKEKVSYIHL